MSYRRPRKTEILRRIDAVRNLFAPRPVAAYSDDATAEALIATAGHDPEYWFDTEHIRAAWKLLTSK